MKLGVISVEIVYSMLLEVLISTVGMIILITHKQSITSVDAVNVNILSRVVVGMILRFPDPAEQLVDIIATIGATSVDKPVDILRSCQFRLTFIFIDEVSVTDRG